MDLYKKEVDIPANIMRKVFLTSSLGNDLYLFKHNIIMSYKALLGSDVL